ncbi:hypothetical protein [Roseovarius sp. EL26]|uniref:hypothetical protein n=1 Tax=Roseovarius sp. EL26 TaxID=2126672 RepID=UPI000EA2B672|nr:hypothetical protein [Roseovarius sp. EL26]
MAQPTYFGVDIIEGKGVRESDIRSLPFYAFWYEGAVETERLKDPETGDIYVPARDWITFCQLFILTGRHRNMPLPNEAAEFDWEI